eukprot:3594425-Amphidinium_carterae.1
MKYQQRSQNGQIQRDSNRSGNDYGWNAMRAFGLLDTALHKNGAGDCRIKPPRPHQESIIPMMRTGVTNIYPRR